MTLNYRNANNQAPAQLQEQAVDQSKMPVYDDAVAERQWSKLQQAQEVAVAQVAPLRVNLPERGLRYAFTQVLQTEIGKEMTINFLAADTKAVNWTARLGMAVAGFALLWAMMAALPVRKLA